MKKAKKISSERLRWILFGSPDRIIATVSLIEGFISIVLAIFVYKYPSPPDYFISLRDTLLVILMVLTIVFLSLKYYKKDELAEHFRSLLSNQLITTHQSLAKFRDHFFYDIRSRFMAEGSLLSLDIDQLQQHYFKEVCHSLLTDTRKLFKDYFQARGLDIGDDLTLTVKLIISLSEAQAIHNRVKGAQADILSPNAKYIVTAYRDPYTWENNPDRKEVKQSVYRVDENTAFDEIINRKKDKFFGNNLRAMYEEGEYKNAHHEWQNLYNSTLVVPIWYRPDNTGSGILHYGVLAIDSKNIKGYELFNDDITFNMLSLSADALAILLGHIDILQRFQ